MSGTPKWILYVCLFALVSLGNAQQPGVSERRACPLTLCTTLLGQDLDPLSLFRGVTADVCTCVCNDDQTPLHLAIRNECDTCVTILSGIPYNCAVDPVDDNDYTPLHQAAAACDIDMTNVLLQRGADPSLKTDMGMTPLCLAASFIDYENCGQVVQNLLDFGADPCEECSDVKALDLALYTSVAEILESNGASACD